MERTAFERALEQRRRENRHLDLHTLHWRVHELRAATATEEEIAEWRRLDRELQADRDDYRSGDWTA